jgi:2-polyprenyl-3-methyl-5-hydroxy-6-metoxy-1,4-benzoquinol methylase
VLDEYFDTVFCMGILYHQREPRAALARIGQLLRPGGELVLETLVLAGGQDDVLIPPGRYAKMNNVYAIPTVRTYRKMAATGRIQPDALRGYDPDDPGGAAPHGLDAV